MRDDPEDDAIDLPFLGDSYAGRQKERDEEYRREYEQWFKSLSPEERRLAKEMGLEEAYLPCGSGGAAKDAAESSRARCEDKVSDEAPGTHSRIELDDETMHELLRMLVGEVMMQENSRLTLECVSLITGLAYCGDSMSSIAKRHNVTRAAVSKRCLELTLGLSLNPSRAMRSLLAREQYFLARQDHLKSRHQRHKK
jgi:hypothetical protein